jgi:hypothetical protein
MDFEFKKATDSEHEIKLESSPIAATWRVGRAIAGQTASFEVRTAFVGEGAPIKVTGRSTGGKKLGKISDVIKRNTFIGRFEIQEDIELDDEVYFEVELSKNGIKTESDRIPVGPAIKITNFAWDKSEARRGDELTLSADVEGLPDQTEVTVVIYEYDTDGAHDKTAELPTKVSGKKVELLWAYEYHEDTDEVPDQEEMQKYGGSYQPPEYFFTIRVDEAEFGVEQESGLLKFKDWIELECIDPFGEPAANAEYVLTLPDGTEKKGELDGDGRAIVEGVPPGPCSVDLTFPEEDEKA